MDESIVMLVVVIILIGVLGVAYVFSKKKNNENGNGAAKNDGSKNSSKNGGAVPRKDMSEFITFDKIANDMIYQKKGEKYTMVIECKGINYDLMSNIEQMAVEEGFIKFLNTLRTPIQLYVQTRTVNLTDNIAKYKERTAAFNDMYMEYTSKYSMAEEDIDVSKEETEALRMEKVKYGNIAEYANDITRYVEKLSLNKYMLQRNYYIIISYYKSELATTEKFSKQEYEELCFRELYTRAQGIISSLASCSVTGRILKSNELAELIYISYNRDDQRALDIKSALESGFYRLYTTTDDVRLRKQELLDEEIRKEAAARIEAAIEEGLKNGTLLTPEQAQAQLDKQIDTEAINIINEADISNRTKERVKAQILKNRKERIEKAKDEKAQQKSTESISSDDRLEETKTEEVEKEQEPQVAVQEEKVEAEPQEVVEEKNEDKVEDKKEEATVVGSLEDDRLGSQVEPEVPQGGLDDRESSTFGNINAEEEKEILTDEGSFNNTETNAKETVENSDDDSIV